LRPRGGSRSRIRITDDAEFRLVKVTVIYDVNNNSFDEDNFHKVTIVGKNPLGLEEAEAETEAEAEVKKYTLQLNASNGERVKRVFIRNAAANSPFITGLGLGQDYTGRVGYFPGSKLDLGR